MRVRNLMTKLIVISRLARKEEIKARGCQASGGMESVTGLGEEALGAPPSTPSLHPHPLHLQTTGWQEERNYIAGLPCKKYIQMIQSLLVEEIKLIIKGAKSYWHGAGCSPFVSTSWTRTSNQGKCTPPTPSISGPTNGSQKTKSEWSFKTFLYRYIQT